ncbi:MAG: hypothetical protein S0880_12905 [Actinomycetota bacterium]|nr:hypothetical protein [Actinomycetota bacterium]
MRWVPPALLVLVWAGLVIASGGSPWSAAGSQFMLMATVGCWLTVAVGNVDDAPHRELLVAAAGSAARLHTSRALAAATIGGVVAVATALLAAVATGCAPQQPCPPFKLAADTPSLVALEIAGVLVGVAIGTFLHRPVVGHLGVTTLVAVASLIALIVVEPTRDLLGRFGRGDATAGYLAVALAVPVAAVAVAAASRLAVRRT